MPLYDAADRYIVPKSTLNRIVLRLQNKAQGGQTSLTPEEENMFEDHLIQLGDWGFPFSSLDLRLTVRGYLDKLCRIIKKFSNNTLGEWARNFMKHHSYKIRPRNCQNIKSSRADLNRDSFEKYFENLKDVIKDVPPGNLLNYDEANLSD